ncbi:MAG TPA: hypothetical protein VK573_11645 [Gemmatimonadales bacterium]|nr:hypothetical protein [Gemmatimonadales bacterium]
MKALATALLVLVAACGEGRVILNVDVLSFLSSSDSTTAYNVPGGIPQADSTVSQLFILPPGLGKSSVDDVTATGAAVIENTAGSGSILFDVFFAKTQGSLFTGTPYLTTGSVTIPGPDTLQLLPPTTVSVADTVFNTDSLWVGIRARLGTNAGPNMTGQLRLTTLGVRVVVQEKVF